MITIINTTHQSYQAEQLHLEDVNLINSRDLSLKHCTGCFGCWMKDPGLCYQEDDMPIILEAIMESDLTVFIADIVLGTVSSELKRVHDKMLPLLLPYMDIVQGEVHHQKRYKTYPEIALVVMDGNHVTDEVLSINQTLYERLAINFRSSLRFLIKDDVSLRGLQDVLNRH